MQLTFFGVNGEGKYSRAFVLVTNGVPEEVELVVTAEIEVPE